MSLINTEIKPFKATADHNGEFVPVSNEDFKGKWSVRPCAGEYNRRAGGPREHPYVFSCTTH